jgi:hypothetical protein
METEPQEIRFGVIAVKMGFVTPEQVVQALQIQVAEDLSTGKHRPIGTILLEKELMNRPQFEQVLKAMEQPKRIM